MPWFDSLVGQPFIDWLSAYSAVAKAPSAAGDPFATSMRDLDDVSPQLRSLDSGTALIHPDSRQRLTDLRAAKLVAQSGDTLSPLGKRVLDAWTSHNVADTTYEHELPRQLILVCEALAYSEPFYCGLANYWKMNAAKYGDDALVEHWPSLYVQTQFSAKLNDFIPMDCVPSGDASLPVWDEGALRSKIQSMVPAGDPALAGLNALAEKLNNTISRGKARKIFVIAILVATNPNPAYATEKLGKWTVPLDRNHVPIPVDVQRICLNIWNTYAPQLNSVATGTNPEHYNVLLKRKNVIFFGPPGTGKTFGAQKIADFWRGAHGSSSVIPVTFHPTYAYEDFVWGWRPDTDDGTKFVRTAGALLEACEIASGGTPTLLLIDEINRADTARVFGELITYIEADKRGLPFRIAQDAKVERSIPPNLYVLGTMNTADRSVSLLDVALRRRFAFVEFAPDPNIFASHSEWSSSVRGISMGRLMSIINARLVSEGVESDRAIGHALFAVSNDSSLALGELRDRIQYDIYPLVVDYCFSDRTRVAEVLAPLVSSDGRLLQLSDDQLIEALTSMCGNSDLVAPLTERADSTNSTVS